MIILILNTQSVAIVRLTPFLQVIALAAQSCVMLVEMLLGATIV
jgi:hypothetical protein